MPSMQPFRTRQSVTLLLRMALSGESCLAILVVQIFTGCFFFFCGDVAAARLASPALLCAGCFLPLRLWLHSAPTSRVSGVLEIASEMEIKKVTSLAANLHSECLKAAECSCGVSGIPCFGLAFASRQVSGERSGRGSGLDFDRRSCAHQPLASDLQAFKMLSKAYSVLSDADARPLFLAKLLGSLGSTTDLCKAQVRPGQSGLSTWSAWANFRGTVLHEKTKRFCRFFATAGEQNLQERDGSRSSCPSQESL